MAIILLWLGAALDPIAHATGLAAIGIDPHAIAQNLVLVAFELDRYLTTIVSQLRDRLELS